MTMKSTVFAVKEYLGGVISRPPTSVLSSFFQGMQALYMMNTLELCDNGKSYISIMEDNLNKIISINDIISIMSLHDYLQDFVPQCITQSLKSSKKYSTSQNCCQVTSY